MADVNSNQAAPVTPVSAAQTAPTATATSTASATAKQPAPALAQADPVESTYTIAELTQAAKAFGVMPECVRAALMEQSDKTFTFSKAKSIVENFMKREVK